MQVFLLAVLLVAIAIGGIAIKMFIIPGETFKKTCGSTFDPKTGERRDCSCASGNVDDCHNTEEEKSSQLVIKPYKP